MTMTDPIADMATRLRNAAAVHKDEVRLPASKLKRHIAGVLQEEGYLTDVSEDGRDLVLKLAGNAGTPKLTATARISKPGRRVYMASSDLPKVRQGLGVAVVSTSQGVMTADAAKRRKLGGEVLLEVY